MSAAISKPQRPRRPVRAEFEPLPTPRRARGVARRALPPAPQEAAASADDAGQEPHRGPFPGDRAG